MLDGRIVEALILLALTAVGGVTTLIKLNLKTLLKELSQNTTISTQARDASNGQLSKTLDQLAAARNQVVALRAIIYERDDRIAYLTARVPQAEALMLDYRDRRTRHATEAEELAAERKALTDPI